MYGPVISLDPNGNTGLFRSRVGLPTSVTLFSSEIEKSEISFQDLTGMEKKTMKFVLPVCMSALKDKQKHKIGINADRSNQSFKEFMGIDSIPGFQADLSEKILELMKTRYNTADPDNDDAVTTFPNNLKGILKEKISN